MASNGSSDSDASADTREQGIEFGQLKQKLAEHDYPTTGDELLAAYGDFELKFPDGEASLREILGKRQSETDADDDIRYESAEEVHQSIYNMAGSDAVGRENYSDRGGSGRGEMEDGDSQPEESV